MFLEFIRIPLGLKVLQDETSQLLRFERQEYIRGWNEIGQLQGFLLSFEETRLIGS